MALTPVRLLALGPTNWLRTQAVYHALAETMSADAPDTVILTAPRQPYLCIGYHQELASVLDRAACERLGLPIVRRRVGGGATYLDRNQLFYQCVFHRSRVPAKVSDVYAALLAAPVAVLRKLGLNAHLVDDNEIEADGQRIAGVGGGWIGEAVVVVGNLLLDFDYDTMARVWHSPSHSFRQLAHDALRASVTTLSRALMGPLPAHEEVQRMLAAEYGAALGRPLMPGQLSRAERRKVAQLEKQLISDAWLNLHANGAQPMRSLKISRGVFVRAEEAQVKGHHVRVALWVREGSIQRAALESDPARAWREAEMALGGVEATDWASALDGVA